MRIFGSYEFWVIAIVLANAPTTFLTLINPIFHDLLDKEVVMFLDDILIYSKDLQEHERLLLEEAKGKITHFEGSF